MTSLQALQTPRSRVRAKALKVLEEKDLVCVEVGFDASKKETYLENLTALFEKVRLTARNRDTVE